jgi:hypothetical protein
MNKSSVPKLYLNGLHITNKYKIHILTDNLSPLYSLNAAFDGDRSRDLDLHILWYEGVLLHARQGARQIFLWL